MTDPGRAARRVIVHSRAHAETALACAERLSLPITLLSPPSAAAYLGATVFREMISQAASVHPNAEFDAILDCGQEPGYAQAALADGITCIRLTADEDVLERIASIATQSGARLDSSDTPALDLLEQDDPDAALSAWLEQ